MRVSNLLFNRIKRINNLKFHNSQSFITLLKVFCAAYITVLCCYDTGFAADPQTYTVTIEPTGNSTIDKTLSSVSNLVSLKKTGAVGAFALAGRIKNDYKRLKEAMDSFGYYDAVITIQLHRPQSSETFQEGTNVEYNQVGPLSRMVPMVMNGNDAELPGFIKAIPSGQPVKIVIKIVKGTQYRIGAIHFTRLMTQDQNENSQSTAHSEDVYPYLPSKTLKNHINTIALTDNQMKAFNLTSGQIASAADIVAAKNRLLDALREGGHALAKVGEPVGYLRPESKTLDIVLSVDAGPVLNLGKIQLKGLDKVHSSFIRKRLALKEGQLYQPSKIEAARQDLSNLSVFSSIDARSGSTVDDQGRLPIELIFKEVKRRTFSFETGYSTDLGGRVGVRWTHNNLFGNAEQLKLVALSTGLGGSAQRGLGYDVYADFTKPDFKRKNQNFNARIEAVKQNLYSYDQTALLVKAGIDRQLNQRWSIFAFLGAIQEHIRQMDQVNSYSMINIPLGVNYDSTGLTNSLMSPTKGLKASLSATPTGSFGDGAVFFGILQGTGSTYFDLANLGLTNPGRSVFAFRGTIGSIQGASRMNLPPDQRLYAGGTSTVRGFRYQGVGPQFPGTKYAVGGKAMDAGTIEYRQRIYNQFGAQAFVDAGQVSENSMPFEGTLRIGAGGGVKYYTPLGPVRVDVALPVNRPPRGDRFEVYISLGETF
ncbi:Outer membrane protein assembly factor BamA [Commensalibacter sp. Nvir]|uniref:autotransporter assembly complex protein TamA n=1 Tax=Commensalibacter sp. Nvir TaxID=3069817 RepID=UPI002D3F0A84|nr:Outer membrane protein assembly factor BamA [Commensalibacter sp. Nvir]